MWDRVPGSTPRVSSTGGKQMGEALPVTARMVQSTNDVIGAAMKLFILIALQVAMSPDPSAAKATSTAKAASFGKAAYKYAPALRSIKSGPATLSKAVFDILYTQLDEVNRALEQKKDNDNKSNHPVTQAVATSPHDNAYVPPVRLVSHSANFVMSKCIANPRNNAQPTDKLDNHIHRCQRSTNNDAAKTNR
jgi:hypothetical protein